MKFIIVAGTPGAGKTAVLLHTIKILLQTEYKAIGCKDRLFVF